MNWFKNKPKYEKLTPTELFNLQQVKKFPPLIIDLRHRSQYKECHIHRAINIPFQIRETNNQEDRDLLELQQKTKPDDAKIFAERNSGEIIVLCGDDMPSIEYVYDRLREENERYNIQYLEGGYVVETE